MGDLSSLGAPMRSAIEGDPVIPTMVPIHRATEGIAGAIRAAGRRSPPKKPAPPKPPPPPTGDDRPVAAVPSRELAKVIARRVSRQLR
jgi:hypothetical protein